MSTLLEEPRTPPAAAAERLRTTMAAVRVSFTWLGTCKTLTPEQKSMAADAFGAEGQFLSAGKKLLDTRHPAFKAVSSVRGRVLAYWRGITLPYPEPGIRLIRQDDIGGFNLQLSTLRAELNEAVGTLNGHYSNLKSAARQRLGRLFNPADYPTSLDGLFAVNWDFPSVDPPDYLRQLSPELYRQESHRVAARFDEAVRLAEEAFTAELAKLVSHLSERLSGQENGKPKIFRDSAIENLSDFFQRFRALNIGSNQQLDQLVSQVHAVVRGIEPQQLRDRQSLRQQVATQLSAVGAALDGLMINRPRRNILRPGGDDGARRST